MPLLADRPLILVVDDALPVRVVIARALTDAGYDVITAPDGHSATVLLKGLRTPPDLVITDLRMPVMGGEDFALWVHHAYPALPIVFVSGFPTPVRALPGPFLPKPFMPHELLHTVWRLLHQAVHETR